MPILCEKAADWVAVIDVDEFVNVRVGMGRWARCWELWPRRIASR